LQAAKLLCGQAKSQERGGSGIPGLEKRETWGTRQVYHLALGVSKWFGHDLILILVHDVPDPLGLQRPNGHSVALQKAHQVANPSQMLNGAVFEPTDRPVLFSIERRLRSGETRWPLQILGEPPSNVVVLIFFVGVESPSVTKRPDSME
jgi:hypothetical protein